MKKLIAISQILIMISGMSATAAPYGSCGAPIGYPCATENCTQEKDAGQFFCRPECPPQKCPEAKYNIEHMFYDKCVYNDKVLVTNSKNVICKGNILKVVFDCAFKSECARAGQKIKFSIPEAIYTKEGTLLIPAGSKVLATVIKINHQKRPNKNAQVYLKFDCLVLTDGTLTPMAGIPCTKDSSLKEGPWMTTGKVAANAIGLGIIGAGAATGFAFIPHPLKLGVAYAIGIPVGVSIGLATGLLSAGLKYHAKAGETVMVILCEDLCIKRQCDCRCR